MQIRTKRRIAAIKALQLDHTFTPLGYSGRDLACTCVILCHLVNKERPERLFNYIASRVRAGKTDGLMQRIKRNNKLFK